MALVTLPRQLTVDANGTPRVGAKLYVYDAGTTTPRITYTTEAFSVQHPHPIPSVTDGTWPPIYVNPEGGDYKISITDAGDVPITGYPIDNIPVSPFGQEDIGRTLYPQTAPETSAGVTPTSYAYEPGDVRRYGAAGDGTTDDTISLLNALKQNNAGGAVVSLVPSATYLCTTWVIYQATGIITIRGNGAAIKGPVSATAFLSPAAGFDIEGVTFDRWSNVVLRALSDSGSAQEFRAHANVFKNGTGFQIDWERPINDYWITENRFESCSGGYAIKIGENTFANQDMYLRGFIRSNYFKSLTASGSTSCAAMLIYGREVSITDNVIDGITGDSGEGWGIYTKVRFGVVSGNRIRNITSTSNGDIVGINIKGAPRAVTTSGVQGFNVVCFGNHIYSVGVVGIKGYGIRAQTDDVLIYGNELEDTGIAGITSDDSNGYSDHQVYGNRVRYASVVAGTNGFRIEGNGFRIRFHNNLVYNAETGILVSPSDVSGSDPLNDVEIDSNIFDVSGANVSVSVSINITNLKIRNNTFRRGDFGFSNNGGAGTLSGLVITDNDLSRTTTKLNGTIPSDTILADNKGFMEGSATYDPASLNDGDGVTTTVSCPGSLVGDYAFAAFSNGLQGITVTAWVSATNTVSVRFQNESGGTLDLASGTLKVRAIRR